MIANSWLHRLQIPPTCSSPYTCTSCVPLFPLLIWKLYILSHVLFSCVACLPFSVVIQRAGIGSAAWCGGTPPYLVSAALHPSTFIFRMNVVVSVLSGLVNDCSDCWRGDWRDLELCPYAVFRAEGRERLPFGFARVIFHLLIILKYNYTFVLRVWPIGSSAFFPPNCISL